MTEVAPTIQRSFTPGQVWLDMSGIPINAHGGGILFHRGVYYWFGEHKIAGEAGNKAHVGVGCYSSRDLYNWKNEGVALAVADDDKSPIRRGCILERPKVLYCKATGRFVMWFHLELKDMGYGAALCGIAVSDTVTGPYRFLRCQRPNVGYWPRNAAEHLRIPPSADDMELLKRLQLRGGPVSGYPTDVIFRRDMPGGQMSRDMTLFEDEDGAAYHIHASEDNGTLHISRLSDDFLDTTGEYIRIFSGRFHEAPALFKHAGKYFLMSSDCTGWKPNPARLSVADSIWGPWTELGNPCRGTPEQMANTFDSQSTHVLPVAGREGAFIYMGDRWRPKDAIDGRYVWLPVEFREGRPALHWQSRWNLSFFDRVSGSIE